MIFASLKRKLRDGKNIKRGYSIVKKKKADVLKCSFEDQPPWHGVHVQKFEIYFRNSHGYIKVNEDL